MHLDFDKNMIVKKIDELKKLINKYSYAYYVNSESLISDYEFDKLFAELFDLEKQYPEFLTPDSPTQRVGAATANFNSVTHNQPMLSLANTYNSNELREFDKRVKIGLEEESYSYSAELKYDGVSISIIYRNGLFFQAVTRGDGLTGDDVTANVKTIRSLPLKVAPTKVNETFLKNFEVRGEIYITEKKFLDINKKRAASEEKLYANPRNLASGTLKLLNPKEVAARSLQIVTYYLFCDEVKLESQIQNLNLLKKLGFPVSDATKLCQDIDEVGTYISEWQTKRHSLEFQTDGIVVKVNNLKQQDFLGVIARSPRWAIAYKYEPETSETTLNDITLQVGRTGAITPVAELEPILLAGSTISRATLHNSDFIAQLDLRIGDTVVIEKGGDVIPKVTKVVIENRQNDSKKYEFPAECICELKSVLVRVEGEASHYCENPNCPWQVRRRIEHFASRNAMDIIGLGEKVVDKLVNLGYLKNISDIYNLCNFRKQLENIEGWGKKSVENLLIAIENSKKNSLYRLIFGLGIRFIGEKSAKILANNFNSLDVLASATKENLLNIHEIGEKMADSVAVFFSGEIERELIEKLRNYGLNFGNDSPTPAEFEQKFAGQTFVFTGELQSMPRTEAAKLIEKQGGKETKSVSKKTTYVVVGESPGSKYNKALELNIKVLSETEFIEKINF